MACKCPKDKEGAVGAAKDASATKNKLVFPLCEPAVASSLKVSVVGCGQVGMAATVYMALGGVCSQLALVDMREEILKGEIMDLVQGSTFMSKIMKFEGGSDYALTEGSAVCVITAGARQEVGESRLSLVQKNTDILKKIIPELIKYSPNTILLLVSNPVDILTYVAWKISGLPKHRVIGSGTNLDSSRFRVMLSQRLGVSPQSVHAWIIGEHGDSSVPVWSGVNIAGVRLRDINPTVGTPQDTEGWNDLHKQVVESAYEIIKLKGYTNWAIGSSIAKLVSSIVHNSHNVHPITTSVQGQLGITEDVFLSLPALVGQVGIEAVIKMDLTDEEQAQLQKSAKLMAEVQAGIQF